MDGTGVVQLPPEDMQRNRYPQLTCAKCATNMYHLTMWVTLYYLFSSGSQGNTNNFVN